MNYDEIVIHVGNPIVCPIGGDILLLIGPIFSIFSIGITGMFVVLL